MAEAHASLSMNVPVDVKEKLERLAKKYKGTQTSVVINLINNEAVRVQDAHLKKTLREEK